MRRLPAAALTLLLLGSAHAASLSSEAFSQPNHQFIAAFQQRFARLDHGSSDVSKNKYNSSTEAIAYVYSNGPLTAGAALSYEYGTRKYDFINRSGNSFDGAGKLRDHTLGINLFATYRTLEGWYGTGNIFAGFNKTKPKSMYSLNTDGTRNDYYGFDSERDTVFATSLEAGKYFDLGDSIFLKPHLGLDYAYVPGVSYEYMNRGLHDSLSAGSQNFLEIPLGVGVGKTFAAGCWVITPSVDVSLVNAIGKMDNKNFQPGFSTFDGTRWRTYGIAGGHTGGRITAGIDASFNQKFDLGLDYTYEGRKSYNDHRLSAMFGISF